MATMGSDAGWGYRPDVIRAPEGQQTGVQLSDTSLLHIGIGAEGGFDTNVFYQEAAQASSPLVRVTPFIQITNSTRTGVKPGGLFYDLSAALQYREYITSDEDIRAQRAFNPIISGMLETGTGQTFSFGLADQFMRVEDPPYGRSQTQIRRIYNVGSAGIRFAPGGGRLAFQLRYSNILDWFEDDDYAFASSMGHDLMLDISWRWLPKTQLYLQAAGGYIHYLNEPGPALALMMLPEKFDSIPIRVVAGLRGLLTEKVAVTLGVGYSTAFYDGGEDPSGLSNLAGLLEINYKPTMLTDLTLGYRHEFRNSVISNFVDVDAVYLGIKQLVAQRLSLHAYGRYELRRYAGVERQDNFVIGGVNADYYVQEWFYAGVGYVLMLNQSAGDPNLALNYTKHQIFFRLGIVY